MKKCKCLGDASNIITWTPEHYYGEDVAKTDKDKLLHICTRCGHAHSTAHEAREEQRGETFRRR
jgi:hypothetical protein